MRVTRRHLLGTAAFAAAGAATAAGFALRPGGLAGYVVDVIAEVYGAEIAGQPATAEFAAAYEDFLLARGIDGRAVNAMLGLGLGAIPAVHAEIDSRARERIVRRFATSTTVVRAHEEGLPLVFTGLAIPYEAPCRNQLSAAARGLG